MLIFAGFILLYDKRGRCKGREEGVVAYINKKLFMTNDIRLGTKKHIIYNPNLVYLSQLWKKPATEF